MTNFTTIRGKFNSAVVFTGSIEKTCEDQIRSFLDHELFSESRVRVMPDVHVGSGAVIGFTATLAERVIPNMIGVDIGCGVSAWKIGKRKMAFDKLDKFIRKHIPAGMAVRRETYSRLESVFDRTFKKESGRSFQSFMHTVHGMCNSFGQNVDHVMCSIGSLGGGNHFIEVDKDQDKNLWLVIHSGSRNFGLKVAEFYQQKALRSTPGDSKIKYLEGDSAREYLVHMNAAQDYARLNRKVMGTIITEQFFKMDEPEQEFIESVHNYISFRDLVIRKGAISAHNGERVIIPFSMADGAVIGRGKGNEDWNFSAPHGAGRKMSRKKAKESLDLDRFRKVMKNVWSSCIDKDTLDESPMAYKKAKEIIASLEDTIVIENRLMPVYNFKAG
jgi:RNA-splicing ligase RtcB